MSVQNRRSGALVPEDAFAEGVAGVEDQFHHLYGFPSAK
jgi:hypothetical protein